MMEIGPTSDVLGEYEAYSPPTDSSPTDSLSWEKVGKIALYSFSFIAVCAFVPALLKKKRQFSYPSVLGNENVLFPINNGVAEPENQPIVQKPPAASESQKEKIKEIFETVALGGLNLASPSVRQRLHQLGDEVRGVHPFEFLKAIPKEHFQTIFSGMNFFKINKVMEGIVEGMEREWARNNLLCFAKGFATDMGKPYLAIMPLIQAREWRPLVDYLFDIKA